MNANVDVKKWDKIWLSDKSDESDSQVVDGVEPDGRIRVVTNGGVTLRYARNEILHHRSIPAPEFSVGDDVRAPNGEVGRVMERFLSRRDSIWCYKVRLRGPDGYPGNNSHLFNANELRPWFFSGHIGGCDADILLRVYAEMQDVRFFKPSPKKQHAALVKLVDNLHTSMKLGAATDEVSGILVKISAVAATIAVGDKGYNKS